MRWIFVTLLSLVLAGFCPAQDVRFDPDPSHLWNRLHRQLHSRTTLDGSSYNQEGLEAPLAAGSLFLTAGDSYHQALERLDAFLQQNAEQLIDNPLKRAILLRDLWAVFVTTADPTRDRQPQRRELQKRLVQVIRRIALEAEEIELLPDNLAIAVESQVYPADDQPGQHLPFLPVDLLAADGPWVLLENRFRRDDLAAPLHAHATAGRSVFLLFIRLPAGRKATKDYVNGLAELQPNQEIPQIPVGTQVALLRRMMLINRAGKMQLSPLTESLQIRVYQQLTSPAMYEFSLRRNDLFAGREGGLRPTGPDEVNYFDLAFMHFTPSEHRDPLETSYQLVTGNRTPVVMESCAKCHAGPGIFGFQSMFAGHHERPPLRDTDINSQVLPVIKRTYQSYAWGLLQGLWETH